MSARLGRTSTGDIRYKNPYENPAFWIAWIPILSKKVGPKTKARLEQILIEEDAKYQKSFKDDGFSIANPFNP